MNDDVENGELNFGDFAKVLLKKMAPMREAGMNSNWITYNASNPFCQNYSESFSWSAGGIPACIRAQGATKTVLLSSRCHDPGRQVY